MNLGLQPCPLLAEGVTRDLIALFGMETDQAALLSLEPGNKRRLGLPDLLDRWELTATSASIAFECAMIATMACDEDLANRIRELIASEDRYAEQKMFGGIGFMIDAHMQSVAFARGLPPEEKK